MNPLKTILKKRNFLRLDIFITPTRFTKEINSSNTKGKYVFEKR